MISNLLRYLLIYRPYFLILGIFALLPCLALIFGFFGARKEKTRLAVNSGYGNLASRITEAVVLGCVAIAIIPLMRRLHFARFGNSNMSPDVIEITNHFYIGLGFVVLIGVVLCVIWRTLPAFMVVNAACIISFLYMAGFINNVEPFGIETVAAKSVSYRITVQKDNTNDEIEGVDVWVNDVYLGKTPIKITLNKFLEKVPYWPDAPGQVKDSIEVVHRNYRSYGSRGYSPRRRLIKFRIPEMPRDDEFKYDLKDDEAADRIRKAIKERKKNTEKQRTYYARFEYAGHAGYGHCSSGDGFGSGSGNGRMRYSGDSRFTASFPSLTKSIEELLDAARMKDYQVDEQWCRTLDAFGRQGWKAVYNAAYFDCINRFKGYGNTFSEPKPSEDGMVRVMDEYASWRYGLKGINSESAAWRAFKRICKSVDEADLYSSVGVEGRALGLLIDKLDQDRLVNEAIRRIRKDYLMSIQPFFNTYIGIGMFEFSRYSHKDRPGLASDYLVVDAVWRLDRYLDEIDDSKPNVVEQKVSNALVACNFPHAYESMLTACWIGGPDLLENFQKFRKAKKRDKRFDWRFSAHGFSDDADMLLNLMVNVNGKEGEKFRSENKEEILKFLENVVTSAQGREAVVFGRLDFLGYDAHLGTESLAAAFWPKYFQLVKDSKEEYGNDKLRRLWSYLVRMEPVFDVDTYVKCWQSSTNRYGQFRYSLHLLENVSPAKRKRIAMAVKKELELNPANILDFKGDKVDTTRVKGLKGQLDLIIAETSKFDFAEHVIRDIKKQRGAKHIIDWLIEKRPGHIVGEMMAKSDDVMLRQKAVELLKAHPTPERIELLKHLAVDEDSSVSTAASEALDELKKIAMEVQK